MGRRDLGGEMTGGERPSQASSSGVPCPVSAPVPAFRELPLIYGAMTVYAIASITLMASRQVGITAGHAVLVAIVLLALTVRAPQAFWDWLPFAFLLAMFQDLAAVAGAVTGIVHPAVAIVVEKGLLGGAIAASWLQQHLGSIPGMSVVAGALVAQYLLNDIAPLLLGLWLWFRHRDRFRPFVAAYVLVMSAGFLIYLVFPEVPPWAAADRSLIPPVNRIVVQTLQHLARGLGTFYASADPEPNAAMPSIHVAIPTIVACMALRHRGRRDTLTWLALGYAATISFGVVYLGEHYVADGLAGIALGVCCCAVAERAGAAWHPPTPATLRARWRRT